MSLYIYIYAYVHRVYYPFMCIFYVLKALYTVHKKTCRICMIVKATVRGFSLFLRWLVKLEIAGCEAVKYCRCKA